MEKTADKFVIRSKDILKENLAGIYLHGSAVMGCFNPAKSDIDLIVIIKEELSDDIKRKFMDMVMELNASAPQKGVEMSVVLKKVCSPFVYPTPYELHFSKPHLSRYLDDPDDYIQKMKGTDKDLAAHFTVIRKRGRCLYGSPIKEVFAEVPKQDYLDSIRNDIAHARDEIKENPMYIVLNLARVLAYQKEEVVLSKKEGGEWAVDHLPAEFHPLIRDALKEYEKGAEVKYDMKSAERYAAYMLEKIFQQ